MSDSGPSPDPATVFALLAAGSSARFGGGKLGVELDGTPLMRWAAQSATKAGFRTRVLVVASREQPVFGLAAEGWSIITNPDADNGMASSIRTAAMAAHGCDRLVLGLADMPFVQPAHLRALAGTDGVVFTRYPSGRWGVPAAFDARNMKRLQALRGDQGAASIDWEGARAILPPSDDDLFDIDTQDDLARAQAIARSRR